MDETKKIKKKRSALSIILEVIADLIIGLTVVLLIYGTISISQNKMPKFFGYSFSTVVSPSMEPTIMVNDCIIVKDFEYDDLEVGDIIVYYNDQEKINVVHRIYSINEDSTIVTKGDNNHSVDTIPVSKDNYIGKVVKYGPFLGLGKITTNFKNLIFFLIVVLFLYIIVYEMINIIKISKEKTKLELEEKNKALEEERNKELERIREELKEEILKEKSNNE